MMTQEEAIINLEKLIALFHTASEQSKMVDYSKIIETLEFAAAALRPISREQVEKMFPGCPYCDMAKANDNIYNKALWVKEAKTSKWTLAGKSLQYCPICGRPLTDEAVEMVMKRLRVLTNDN